MAQIKSASPALPVISIFTGYIPAPFAHQQIETGLTEMETALYGKPQGKQNSKIGMAFVGMLLGGRLLVL